MLSEKGAVPPAPGELLCAGPRGLRRKGASVLHAAQSHADPAACLHCPACCCVAHCLGARSIQYEVIALVLSSLAESPSLCRMSTREGPPSLSAFSLASPPSISSQRMSVTSGSPLQCHTGPCILHTANDVSLYLWYLML